MSFSLLLVLVGSGIVVVSIQGLNGGIVVVGVRRSCGRVWQPLVIG